MSVWTNEAVETLRQRAAEGWQYSQVAKDIWDTHGVHVTRNAVIGKAHRLRLTNSLPKQGREVRKQKGVPRSHKKIASRLKFLAVVARPKPKRAAPSGNGNGTKPKSFAQLTNTSCRWPVDTPKAVRYCGHRVVAGQPYCAAHCTLAYVKPAASRGVRHV